MYLKNLILVFVLSVLFFGAVVALSGMKSDYSELLAPRRKSNRKFSLGLKYSYSAFALGVGSYGTYKLGEATATGFFYDVGLHY